MSKDLECSLNFLLLLLLRSTPKCDTPGQVIRHFRFQLMAVLGDSHDSPFIVPMFFLFRIKSKRDTSEPEYLPWHEIVLRRPDKPVVSF